MRSMRRNKERKSGQRIDKGNLFQQGIPFFPSHYSIIFIAITLPFLFSLFCAVAISKIGRRLALIDNPGIRSSHSLPTPRGGGIGIWLAFVIIGLFFFKDNAFTLIAGIAGLFMRMPLLHFITDGKEEKT